MISVIIPAKQEEQYIAATLQCLTAQTSIPNEVIVVCNGCTDSTREIAESFADTLHLQVISSQQGIGRACNAGAKIAAGDILYSSMPTHYSRQKHLKK